MPGLVTPLSGPCPTRAYFSCLPPDLIPWVQAVETIARTPYPMTERTLRRKFLAAGGRVYRFKGVRGEKVSRTAILEFHRDYWHGWCRSLPPPTSR